MPNEKKVFCVEIDNGSPRYVYAESKEEVYAAIRTRYDEFSDVIVREIDIIPFAEFKASLIRR